MVIDDGVRLAALGLLDQLGTGRLRHGPRRTLRDHLCGTCELLERWNAPADACLAGLFHSIYGTEVFRAVAAALSQRPRIRAVIGERAEELAYLFSACDRQALFHGLSSPDPPVLRDRFADCDRPLATETRAALLEI